MSKAIQTGNRRPKILYVSPCSPGGAAYGTRVRMMHAAKALAEIGDVSFVVAGIDEKGEADNESGGGYRVEDYFELQEIWPRSLWERLRCTFDPKFVNTHGHRVDPAMAACLLNCVHRYDLVWLHHMRTPDVFGNWAWPRSVLDIDDVPSTHLRTLRVSSPNWGERIRAGFKMPICRQRERLLPERFDVLAVCSEEDRDYLGLSMPVHVIPNSFKAPQGEPVRCPSDPPRLGFIGLLNYPPNREGVRWFVDRCWPKIRESVPGVQLRLVGRGTDEEYGAAGNEIRGLGFVDDADAEMSTWSAMVVPINRGAGTRVKIAEAFSRKCPVVSTTVGAFGYPLEDGGNLFLGDTPNEFAESCIRVLRERELAGQVAERAWKQFMENWSWEAIRPHVWAAAEDCLRITRDSEGKS